MPVRRWVWPRSGWPSPATPLRRHDGPWRTRQQAGRHLAAASHYNNVRWRDHPVSLACGLAILGFVNGFLRISDGGLAGRFIAGAASAAGVGIIAAFAVWHARRKARHHND